MAEKLEQFRSGMCVYTSRAIDAMKAGKPGDTYTRQELANIVGRSIENGTVGYGNVRSAINYCKGHGVFWHWSRATKRYVCLAPSEISEETQRGVSSVHRKTGQVLKGAACVRTSDLTPDDRRQYELATTRLALARTATSAAMKKRLESTATLNMPTLEDLAGAFAKK